MSSRPGHITRVLGEGCFVGGCKIQLGAGFPYSSVEAKIGTAGSMPGKPGASGGHLPDTIRTETKSARARPGAQCSILQ